MKKFFVFLIVAVMTVLTAVAFVGCGENVGAADDSGAESVTSASGNASVIDVSSGESAKISVSSESVSSMPDTSSGDVSIIDVSSGESAKTSVSSESVSSIPDTSSSDASVSSGDETAQNGTFYSLKDAYNNGWLTKENIMCISYYCTGEVKEVTERNDRGEVLTRTIDFTPGTSAPVLNEKTESNIKNTHYEQHPILVKYNGEYDLIIDCFGVYNGCYVISIDSDIFEYGASFIRYDIADITWAIAPPGLTVFRYN